jgi:hypothetical protein
VAGASDNGIGVLGIGNTNEGVHGNSSSANAAGVSGFNLNTSQPSGPGVFGHSGFGAGVVGDSDSFDGVWGVSRNPKAAGVSGHSLNQDGSVNRNGLAGFFDGSVTVTGDVSLPGGDCAEQFDIAGAQQPEPGTVVVIDHEGALRESQEAYDRKVAGVVSGGGEYKSGIVLDKRPSQAENRLPIALVGKVYCKVDTAYSPIEVGDLLTTSPTPGHAMRAGDPSRAFGAVIGKALRSMCGGCGLIPILIALQ